jgi:asparagine synthetase B (glutamine-hydrolysing)
VPFLDHEFVELAGRVPPELKLADGGKGVLKRASRGVVPDAVIDRTKGSFPVPAIRQLTGPYLDRVRDGRRNFYRVRADRPMRHPVEHGHRVGEILAVLHENQAGDTT